MQASAADKLPSDRESTLELLRQVHTAAKLAGRSSNHAGQEQQADGHRYRREDDERRKNGSAGQQPEGGPQVITTTSQLKGRPWRPAPCSEWQVSGLLLTSASHATSVICMCTF